LRTLTYLVATSLDGFIAASDGSFDAFPMEGDHFEILHRDFVDTMPAPAQDALGLTPTNERFDTVVMGWNTYAVGLPGVADPYPHLRQIVFSRRHEAIAGAAAIVTDEKPVEVVRSLKAEETGSGIWLCGGGQLAGELVGEIDRLVLKVNPILLGSGIPAISGATFEPHAFTLASSRSFTSGVVINEYEKTA
jgi:dihydrofolate reductase